MAMEAVCCSPVAACFRRTTISAGSSSPCSSNLLRENVCPASSATRESLRCGLVLLERWEAARGLQEGSPRYGRTNKAGIQQRRRSWFISASVKDGGTEKDYKYYEALTRGGEEVTAMMKDMVELLKDIAMNEEEEEVAVKMAAASAVAHRLDKLDQSFLLALDFMTHQAETDNDDKRKSLLVLMKETVLEQLSQKSPPQVQVVGLLCTTELKNERQDILRRSAGGGGTFSTKTGGKLSIPGSNLSDIAAQADDILATMEDKPKVPNRKLLAKLVLVREEARSLLAGGLLDERNDNRGLKNLHESEVNFLSKVIAMKPSPQTRARLANVLEGKDEGADPETDESERKPQGLIRKPQPEAEKKEKKIPPVRPGMFVDTVTKVMGAMYSTNARGVTVQHLEWIHRQTMEILQEIAFS